MIETRQKYSINILKFWRHNDMKLHNPRLEIQLIVMEMKVATNLFTTFVVTLQTQQNYRNRKWKT